LRGCSSISLPISGWNPLATPKARRGELLRQDLFDEFCEEFTREMNRLGREHRASLWAATREIGQLDTARKKLIEMAMEGVAGIGGEGRAERNAARREQLEAQPRCHRGAAATLASGDGPNLPHEGHRAG
jgi:hypothetical protein